MKLEVPIKVDIDDVTNLIHDLQCLQTYKLWENDDTVLVSLDSVVGVFADHIRAKKRGKDTNVPTNSALDHIHNVVRDDAYRRGYEQGKADANCPEIPDSWVDAIPVPWIEAEIKKLRDMDNGFASLSDGQIEAMLNKWRKEQNEGI